METSATKVILGILSGCLLAGTVTAQNTVQGFNFSVYPTNLSYLASDSTNLCTVSFRNLLQTNLVVEPDPAGGPNLATNRVIISNFTNVGVTVSGAGLGAMSLFNDGILPDAMGNDSVFSGWLIAPAVTETKRIIAQFTVVGTNLNYVNEYGELEPRWVTNTSEATFFVVPRPSNDSYSRAAKVPSGGALILATNNFASMEAGEPLHMSVKTCAASVWWNWSLGVSTNVLIDTAGTAFQPILAVYTGLGLNKLAPVASAAFSPSGYMKPAVAFFAEAGVTYHVVVAGMTPSDAGSIRIRFAPGAVYDASGPVVKINSPVNNSLFTTNLVEFSGTATELRAGESGVQQVFLRVNDQAPVLADGTTNWHGWLTLPPGTNFIQAFGIDYVGNGGPIQAVRVLYINPTNDDFASPIELAGLAGGDLAMNERATREPGEPLHAGNDGGRSIWYSWRAPGNGTLFLSTTNSDFDTLLGLYTGESVGQLHEVAANDDAFENSRFSELSAEVQSNRWYHIAVDGYGGASGKVRLQFEFIAGLHPQVYLVSLPPCSGGIVKPATGSYPANTVLEITAVPDPDFVFDHWQGSYISTNNPLRVLVTNNLEFSASFRFTNYTETFESGTWGPLGWAKQGDAAWFVQPLSSGGGKWAVQAGHITNNQSSELLLNAHCLAGTAFFDYRVSAEDGFDFLEFFLNGKIVAKWTGETGWQTCRFEVPAGLNTFRWRYVKDGNFSFGLDTAFLDNLALPQGRLEPRLEIRAGDNQILKLTIRGRLEQVYNVQSSGNLLDWATEAAKPAVGGQFELTVPVAQGNPARYFRAIIP